MRVVTFQSREVTNTIIQNGKVETVCKFGRYIPSYIRRTEYDRQFLKIDGEIKVYDDESKAMHAYLMGNSEEKYKVYPFYAYHQHKFCGDMYNMSVHTIFNSASHFIAYMGYDRRDIIELEVPDGEMLEYRVVDAYSECLLPYIKREWVVSILWFDTYVNEPVCGELAQQYRNQVFREDTYRMCYGNSIVLSGHGYGDKVDCCLSPVLLSKIEDVSIQRDYVQPAVFNLFKKYLYVLRHGLNLTDISSVNGRLATAEMPDVVSANKIEAFNACRLTLCENTNTTIFSNVLEYPERIKLLQVEGINEINSF